MAPAKVVEGYGIVLSILAVGCLASVESVRKGEGGMRGGVLILLAAGLTAAPMLAKGKDKTLPS